MTQSSRKINLKKDTTNQIKSEKLYACENNNNSKGKGRVY